MQDGTAPQPTTENYPDSGVEVEKLCSKGIKPEIIYILAVMTAGLWEKLFQFALSIHLYPWTLYIVLYLWALSVSPTRLGEILDFRVWGCRKII